MGAFKGIATIVKFANLTLGRGDLEAAYQGYHDALILFTKLNNSRGVSYNNGTTITRSSLEPRQTFENSHFFLVA